MSDTLVVDASAALADMLDEPEAVRVRTVLSAHLAGGGSLIVPDLFWHEVVNGLVRHATPFGEVVGMLRDLDEMPIGTASTDRALLLLAGSLMTDHGLTAYDAAYLALARAMDGDLLTLDRRLGAAAGPRSLLTRVRGTNETLEPSGSSASEIVAAHGAYLAELRRQAEAGILR